MWVKYARPVPTLSQHTNPTHTNAPLTHHLSALYVALLVLLYRSVGWRAVITQGFVWTTLCDAESAMNAGKLVVAAAALLLFPKWTDACKCFPTPICEHVENADVVLRAVLVSR